MPVAELNFAGECYHCGGGAGKGGGGGKQCCAGVRVCVRSRVSVCAPSCV